MNLWRGISGEVSLARYLWRRLSCEGSRTTHHRRRITDDASQTTSRTTLGSACHSFFSLSSLSLSHCRAFAGEGGCAERCAGCRGAGAAGGGEEGV